MANPPRITPPTGAAKPASAKPAGAARKPRAPRPAAPAAALPATSGSDWPLRLTLIVAAGIFVLDQALKWLVVSYLDLATRREIDVIEPFLNLRMAWNEGMNFGLLSSSADPMRWFLIGIALVISVWVAVWVQRSRPGRFARIAAGLLIGGALGNVIDRVMYGAVADFLNMSLPGWTNPYSFNVADISIFAGAIGLALQPGPARDGTGGQAA